MEEITRFEKKRILRYLHAGFPKAQRRNRAREWLNGLKGLIFSSQFSGTWQKLDKVRRKPRVTHLS